MTAKKAISFRVDDFEYEEILRYARMKGHGGQRPASTFAHYAVFQQMKKYPLSEAEIVKYGERYVEGTGSPKVAQPDASMANSKRLSDGENETEQLFGEYARRQGV
jgi:hypothetical protein